MLLELTPAQTRAYIKIHRESGQTIVRYSSVLREVYKSLDLSQSLCVELYARKNEISVQERQEIISANLQDYMRYRFAIRSTLHKAATFRALYGYQVYVKPFINGKNVVYVYFYNEDSEPKLIFFEQ